MLHKNLLYNKDVNVCFCILYVPDNIAFGNQLDEVGVKCEWLAK
jgi:hypothetical protein